MCVASQRGGQEREEYSGWRQTQKGARSSISSTRAGDGGEFGVGKYHSAGRVSSLLVPH